MRRLFAVLGADVSDSLSPKIHSAAALALDLDLAYVPVSCATREKFLRAVEALRELGAGGANITAPYKRDALELAGAGATDTAREIAAVNTFTFREDGTIHGDNTDGPALQAIVAELPLQRVQILGAGGASRAAAWALSRAGAKEVFVSVRRRAEVPALPGVKTHPLAPVPGATLVISTLPPERDLAQKVISEFIDLTARPVILDVTYRIDAPPPLVELARARGLDARDGRGMLVEQGARSLALWTGGELSRIAASMKLALGLS